jgi:hypothetical protein
MQPSYQFTSTKWVAALQGCNMRISIDGETGFMDNVFIERLWHFSENSSGLVRTPILYLMLIKGFFAH